MSMAIADYEQLRAFAGRLEQYLNTITKETNTVQEAFRGLKGTWRDEKSASFEKTLRELVNAQTAFKENASKQIPYLLAQADDLERYMKR